MEESRRHLLPNPLASASMASQAVWWWVLDIFKKGYKKDLDLNDLYEVMEEDKTDYVTQRLEKLVALY
jgi:hypothetical protein